MAQTISAQVVPNLSGEVFDVVGTSRTETYDFTNDAGLTNRITTNWASSPGADTANFNISLTNNIKSFVDRFNGYPTPVEKLARNIAILKGTTAVGVGLDFSKTWAVINQADNTKFIRLDNESVFNPTSVDSHTQWNNWYSRFKGSFDASGFPVSTFESSLTQFSIMKRQGNATYTFNGYSPIMTHSGEALARNIGTQTNNLVFYTKDTTSATDRFARRGSTLFCRVEVELYDTEYTICDFGIQIKTIEHIWFTGNKFYIMVLADDNSKYTFVSAPYDSILEEGAVCNLTAQSVLYSLIVVNTNIDPESAQANISANFLTYQSVVVVTTLPTESAEASIVVQNSTSTEVAVYRTLDIESAVSSILFSNLDYIYDPPSPPPIPPDPIPAGPYDEPSVPDIVYSIYTIQSITYT
jgi:hypothetical protein